MTLSSKTIISIQNSYKNMSRLDSTTKSNKIKQLEKNKDDSKKDSSGSKTYILEGGIIKVYVTDESGELKLIKQMPLEAAPLSILLQVKASNLSDTILLQEAIETKMKEENPGSNYSKSGLSPEFDDN